MSSACECHINPKECKWCLSVNIEQAKILIDANKYHDRDTGDLLTTMEYGDALYLIEQAQQVGHSKESSREFIKTTVGLDVENRKLKDENERLRKALIEIKNKGTYGTDINTGYIMRSLESEIASKALEGAK